MKPSTTRLAGCMGLALAAWVCTTPAAAQSAQERAIRARQSGYYLMGQQMARIGATVRGELPYDRAGLEASVDALDLIGRLVVDYYPTGSDRGQTKADPGIWREAPRFAQMAQETQAEVARLKVAVRAGDMATLKEAFGATSKSCKACHEAYRAR